MVGCCKLAVKAVIAALLMVLLCCVERYQVGKAAPSQAIDSPKEVKDPRVRIVTPVKKQQFAPGDTVTVLVEFPAGLQVAGQDLNQPQ